MNANAVWSVTGLNEYVSALLSSDVRLSELRVRGEISGFKRHSSGHLYFSIKDDHALVRCVMFRQQAMRLGFQPRDGMLVILSGSASLYARDGAFQLYARTMEPCGDGALYQRFVELKERLEKAGYFDAARKRPIPLLPRCVGVVTSATGAAIRDILQIIDRRFPNMPAILSPCAVQGEGAGTEIAHAIRRLCEDERADVLIVGRGGGSLEDLWAFNEPVVADAIYRSEIPVISAVGHETDYTIADFVADLRAPTPSAAAELAVPEYDVCADTLAAIRRRLMKALTHDLQARRSRIEYLMRSRAFLQTENRLSACRQSVDALRERAVLSAAGTVDAIRRRIAEYAARLDAMNPQSVLRRGYALITDTAGRTIIHTEKLHAGMDVGMRLYDGEARARITHVAGKDDSQHGESHTVRRSPENA